MCKGLFILYYVSRSAVPLVTGPNLEEFSRGYTEWFYFNVGSDKIIIYDKPSI